MDAWQAVMLAVVALLVGALLPALVQLTLALRSLRSTADRLDRVTAKFEDGGGIDRLLEGIDSLSRMVSRLQETTRVAAAVGAAVGPAVGAAVRSWRASHGDGDPAAASPGEPSPAPERKEAKS